MDVKERELARKREIFATQEFSPSDVERIKRNRQELQQHIDLLRNDTQELEKQICENEMKISKQQEKVREAENQGTENEREAVG